MTPDLFWTESRSLPVVLSPEEIQARGEQLAEAIRLSLELKVKHKGQCLQMKAEANEAAGAVYKLATVVAERQEVRALLVQCTVNLGLGLVEECRTDTGEIIRTRNATAGDRMRVQGTLPLESEQPNGPE